jgi:Tfp pilus assembly protein PilO
VDRNRIKMIVAALSGVAVLALGFLLGVQPQLAAASDAVAQRASVEQQNEAHRATLAQLVAENDELSTLTADRDARRASVPDAADMPELIRQLDEMAAAAGVPVTSFTTSDAVSYEIPASASAPAADAAPAEGTESTEGTDATAAPAEAEGTAAPTTFTDPAVTGANFSTIAVTVDVQGSYDQALDFVDKLQKGSRLFLVTTITSSETEGGEGDAAAPGAQTWTIGGLVFVLQDGDDAPADDDATTTAPTQAEGTDDGTDATAEGTDATAAGN